MNDDSFISWIIIKNPYFVNKYLVDFSSEEVGNEERQAKISANY
jgi:hypothetical protein